MLYICATPIGNLEDITLRVLRILQEVDIIVAEDTRQTRKLLNHFEITGKLISLHQHNEYQKSDYIIELLQEGNQIALVSDAGMPGISDPGAELINKAIALEIPMTVLPGANAAITGVVQSGLLTGPFYFYGFLPRKKRDREAVLNELLTIKDPIIFYEAPHRLLTTLEAIQESFGDRSCAISRELTKKFEENCRGKISELIEHFTKKSPRGEFVITVAGALRSSKVKPDLTEFDLKTHLITQMKQGISKKDAIKATAKLLGVNKNEVYQKALEIDLPTKLED